MKWLRPIVFVLLIVGCLAFLATLTLPHSGRSTRAKPTAAQTQIAIFQTALIAFEVDNGFYPKSLEELVVTLSTATNWHGPYLKSAQIPMDPWNRPYRYTCPGKHNLNDIDLMSAGPDGQAETDDDITNWQPKR